jgi:hypothetical protein
MTAKRAEIRSLSYATQEEVRIPVRDDARGFVILLNAGNRDGRQVLVRSVVAMSDLIDAVTLVPRADGMRVIDFYSEEAPSNEYLQGLIDGSAAELAEFAPPNPPIIVGSP